jgi:hypothetical protein
VKFVNRKILLLSTAMIAAMMMSLAIAPAMAKPNILTVIVKDATRKPVYNARVQVWGDTGAGTILLAQAYTDIRGQAVIDLSPYPSLQYVTVYVNGQLAAGNYQLSSKLSGRITYSLP